MPDFEWHILEGDHAEPQAENEAMTRADFEWQIAEEAGAGRAPAPGPPVRLARRGWPVALAVVVAMAAAGAALLVAANRRTEEAIAGIKMDVLASHALVQRAADLADRELLDVLLNPGWRITQHELLDWRLITYGSLIIWTGFEKCGKFSAWPRY